MKRATWTMAWVAALAGCVSLAGCGDDDDGQWGALPLLEAGTMTGYDAGPPPSKQMCLDSGGQSEECRQCACDSCARDWVQCQELDGCQTIRDCGRTHGCTGTACYLGPCTKTIDNNGGPFGVPAAVAVDLTACLAEAGCEDVNDGSGKPCKLLEEDDMSDAGMSDGG